MVALRAIRPRRFKLIDPAHTKIELQAGIREYLNAVKDELLSGYKTVPKSKAYRRTGNLRRGARVVVHSPNFGTLTFLSPYSVYVVGPRRGTGRGLGAHQARVMREKGWKSITDVARDTARQYAQIMNRRISPSPGTGEFFVE